MLIILRLSLQKLVCILIAFFYYQLNIKNVFLYENLQEEAYTFQPPSYEVLREMEKGDEKGLQI